ncbi:MAG: hypothetical protein B6I24_06595 [Bacteroidetes bacterium 4572_128]|nr:MAG: hypothetical protein B6I24_06595 [Bacteroidetes bacterium 4572_128]
MKNFILFFIFLLFSQISFSQENIAEARSMNIGETVTVTGIVTNGSELGSIRYFQDETAGIAAYGSQLSDVERGDEITVTGVLKDYNYLLEIDPVTSFTVNSSNNEISPTIVNISELGENTESELVQFDNVTFSNGGESFGSNTSYTFSDGTNNVTTYIGSSSPLVGGLIPVGSISIVGIASQYSYSSPNSGYQLIIRDLDDIVGGGEISITSSLEIDNITNNSFDISWTTDNEGSTGLFYGNTLDLELGTLYNEENTTEHTINIDGLNASEVVYVKAFSDNSFSNGTDAITLTESADDTLINYISRAKYSVDLCIYNLNNTGISNISNALNDAHNNGLRVRVIFGGTNVNMGIGDLNASVPRLASPEAQEYGIMHNKFVIIDANSENPNDPILWTGSMNMTSGNVNQDANNIIILQDQSITKVYQMEFEEMWGSDGENPDASNSKFSIEKTDNTPHKLLINDKIVECYFSPSDGANSKIIETINSANDELFIEEGECSDLAVSILNENLGNSFVSDNIVGGTLHHKLMIVDPNNPNSDPTVLTGSHNWSNAANNKNDENTLIIHSEDIANLYYQEFMHRFTANNGVVNIENINLENKLLIYPNPTKNKFYLKTDKMQEMNIEIFDIFGKKIFYKNYFDKDVSIDLCQEKKGIYFMKIKTENKSFTKKIILN